MREKGARSGLVGSKNRRGGIVAGTGSVVTMMMLGDGGNEAGEEICFVTEGL